jgi:ribosomal protein S13
MSLEENLQNIHGIGEQKAKEIMEVVESNSVNSDVEENVKNAYDYYQEGEYSYMGKFLERAMEAL